MQVNHGLGLGSPSSGTTIIGGGLLASTTCATTEGMNHEEAENAWGLVRIPSGSERVEDADEEVFLLYTELQASKGSEGNTSSSFRGLGHLDSRQDTLVITLEIKSPTARNETLNSVNMEATNSKAVTKRRNRSKRVDNEEKSVEIKIIQDKTALRTRKGDTGSVLWRASVDFAQETLRQLENRKHGGFLDRETLKKSHIVELGAGTGLLAVAFSPYVRHYTVTDIADLVPLLRKNVAANFPKPVDLRVHPAATLGANISIEALDWVLLHSTPETHKHRLINFDPADLILVVDCIYHPSLLPALVGTLNHLAIPGQTTVLVVVELRQEDVIREFLQLWLESGPWEIWRISGVLSRPYAIWAGRRSGASEI